MTETLLFYTDGVLFLLMTLSVAYLLVFAIASVFKRSAIYPDTNTEHRFIVLFPAYKEDLIIETAVSSFLNQNYPKRLYDVVVISDQMKEETNRKLIRLGAKVLKANYQNSSKAKALQLAIHSLPPKAYDIVVIMDADNLVDHSYLKEINKAYAGGCLSIQTHRIAKSRKTSTATLDAISEEINNSIFRKGHVRLGFSSALIGSGMAFDYKWFRRNINNISTAGEDKELEALLLSQGIYTEYLDHVFVYDEKVSKDDVFYRQRRRWVASQYGALVRSLPKVFSAVVSLNKDYCNKVIQWMILPRSVLLLGITFFAALFTLFDLTLAIKWWGLFFLLVFTLYIAIPSYLVDKKLLYSIKKVPWLSFLMFLNLFRIKGVNKKFIHTKHNEEV